MRRFLAGSRIRDRRRARGVKQTELARIVGISGSYLNLIEHNRRKASPRVLAAIADALDIPPESFDERAETALATELRDAAAGLPHEAPEMEALEELVGRYPGWARLLAAESRRSRDLASAVDVMTSRYNDDPFLQSSLHEMLTGITAIRASASILATEDQIPKDQADRFLAAVLSESVRLSDAAGQLANYFDRVVAEPTASVSIHEALDRFLSQHDYVFPQLEEPTDTDAVIANLVASEERDENEAKEIARWLHLYALDARAMPLQKFAATAQAAQYAPAPLAEAFNVSLHAVFRRLATLRRDGLDAPAFGLVIINAAGHPLYRRTLPDFSPPRFASICAVWPVFQALSVPGQPLEDLIELPGGQQYLSRAIALPLQTPRFGARPAMSSAMLVTQAMLGEPPANNVALPVGTICRVCTRTQCAARSEPPILRGADDIARTSQTGSQ